MKRGFVPRPVTFEVPCSRCRQPIAVSTPALPRKGFGMRIPVQCPACGQGGYVTVRGDGNPAGSGTPKPTP